MENKNYSITEQKFKAFRDGVSVFIVHLVADTAADIPEPQENWDAGSRCDVLAGGGKTYLLSNTGQWEEVHFFDFGGNDAPIGIITMNLTGVEAGIGFLDVIPDDPDPVYDETKIALILLDENDELTENIMYCEDTEEVYGALYGGGAARYKMRCGSEVPVANLDRRLMGTTKLRIAEILTPITAFSNAYYFDSCTNLKSVSLPSSLESIGSSVFWGCTSLETITIAKPENSIPGAPWDAPNATVIWTG